MIRLPIARQVSEKFWHWLHVRDNTVGMVFSTTLCKSVVGTLAHILILESQGIHLRAYNIMYWAGLYKQLSMNE